jgi:parvulin-like peptidyl-prolyl isomerase
LETLTLKRWLSEPLLHFVVLGALIFAWYSLVSSDRPGDQEIVVSKGQQQHLVTAFSRTWQRPPTADEFNNLVDDWIREELAYREGQKMGLDQDDTIIRRRLRQKLELLAEDIVSLAQPTDEQLQEYLVENQQDFLQEPNYSLRQIYFSLDRRGAQAEQDLEQALVLLSSGQALVDTEQMGDPLPLPHRLVGERESALAGQFGTVFTQDLAGLEVGRWQGPVRSGFGLHLVLIEDFIPGRALGLDEARQQVSRDWFNRQRIQTIDQLYARLLEQYTLTVEPMDEENTGE